MAYGQKVKSWKAWDGTADIEAESGQVITIAECDSTYKVLNVGSATVVSND